MNSLTFERIIRFSLHLFLLLITPQCVGVLGRVNAQDLDEATISGNVRDQNGAVIPGATVTIELVDTSKTRTLSTSIEGRFRFIELTPGNYTLRVSSAGFSSETSSVVSVDSGQQASIDFTLRPADVSVEQSVAAEATTLAIDTTRTIVGGTITTDQTESLPNFSRSPLDLVFTLPGVTEEPLSTRDLAEDRNSTTATTPEEAGMIALSGGPAYSNNLTIDGLDNNDDRAARERFQPSLEAIAEVQVITNQFSAEYGRASGGRVNFRTRSGTDQLHGRAFVFFRDDILNANTLKNNSLGLKRLPLTELIPGFTLSGPLIIPPLKVDGKVRSYFLVSFEQATVLDTALIDTLVPVDPNGVFRLPRPTTLDGRRFEMVSMPAISAEVAPFITAVNTPNRNRNFTARVDHQFSESHNGTVSLHSGRQNNLRQFGGGNRLAEALQGKIRKSDSLSYTDNYIFSATLVNQARIQFSRLTPALVASGGNTPVVLISLNDPLPESDPQHRSGTLVAGSSTAGGSDRLEARWQIQDTLTIVRDAHTWRLGADLQRIKSTFIDLSDASGTFNFESAGDFLSSRPSRYRQNFQTESTQRNNYFSIFVQDEWRPKANLTLSFGLRYESEKVVRDRNNLAPRVALAWDPFGDGRTVLRAGGGIFYNRALLRTIDDFMLGARQLFFDTNALRNPVTGRLLTATERRAFIAANISFPQTFVASSSLIAQNAVRNSNFLRRIDPGLRIPESYQANLGFERDIGRGFVFEARYTWNRGIHLWREFNANAPRVPAGYRDLTDYLLSRDFANFRSGPGNIRPLYDVTSAGELVRFTLMPFDPMNPHRCPSPFSSSNPDVVGCIVESGVPISLFNLNSFSSSTSVEVALAALRDLRPDPTLGEVEQLASIGNSFYQGLTFELRRGFVASDAGANISFRLAYTLSHLVDDGIVNTSDALTPGDFRSERARSLLDRRHRFVFSGTIDLPRLLGGLRVSPILRLASGAPFNISIGGADRNLDDVSNDRPIYTGDVRRLIARNSRREPDASLLPFFALPTIGRKGNLPRNAGRGFGLFFFDVSITREFRINDRLRVRPVVEINNALNKTVWSFGSEFINFTALGPSATPAQRQEFLESFLLATHTMRPRMIRLGIRVDF